MNVDRDEEFARERGWVACGELRVIRQIERPIGMVVLCEVATASHLVEVWTAVEEKPSAESRVFYAPLEHVVWMFPKQGREKRYLAPRERRVRPARGEWRRWLRGRWFSACAIWAEAMGLELFQADMERRAAEVGLEKNFRVLSAGGAA